MQKLPILKPGDRVAIIAPASRFSEKRLFDLKELLSSWELNYTIDIDILGDDLLCANSDEIRFKNLKDSLQNPDIKAIFCVRGGYGSMRLIPSLTKIKSSPAPKLFIGMSDMTALQLYLQQQWQWPTIHGAAVVDKFSHESIIHLKKLLFGELNSLELKGLPLNAAAKTNHKIHTTITGGNLTLVQTSIGTAWEIKAQNKILLLEEVGERGYRIDRMLEHLRQANALKDITAILLGDFIDGPEPNGSSLIQPVLERFAQNCDIPVIQIKNIGHGLNNIAIPLGTKADLQLGDEIKLTCWR